MSTAQRGFASMAPEKRKAIASLGGKAAHAQGKAHRWTVDEAQAAGRKGGSARAAKRGRDDAQTTGQDTGTGQDAQAATV
jgi:general stress protein YciG